METQDRDDNITLDIRAYTPQSFDEDAPEAPVTTGSSPEDFREAVKQQEGNLSTFDPHPGTTPSEVDFDSIKFQRENTLLTNAESYASSIREEAQLYVQQLRGEVETLNHEAELRYEEATKVKEAAEAEARSLIEEAEAQVESIRGGAHQEGYDAGWEEGMTKRYEEAGIYLEQMEAICKEIGQFRKRVAYYTEKDGLRLAMMMARKVLQSELKINKQAILKLVASTLAKMEGKGTFRVLVSEADHEFILKARPSLERFLDEEQSLVFRARPDLSPGNVLIETDREMIDLTFDSQFYHLEKKLEQTLAERETILTQTRAESRGLPTAPAPGEDPDGERSVGTIDIGGSPDSESPPAEG